MNIIDKIRPVAEAEGYEIAHGEESLGEHMFGLVILAKMSNRKLCDDDGSTFYRAADQIKNGLQTMSAELDPEGPAKRESHRAEIANIYRAAGVETIYMEALPNGYCDRPCCLNKPWVRVTSAIGHVVIGRRKSVISIDWSDSLVKKTGEELIPYDDVTRWDSGIHAWGVDKAIEYIRALHKVG